MGRNVDTTSPLDKKVFTLSDARFDDINVGISLTASVTAIAVSGQGWFDFIALRNANAVGGFSNTDTKVDVYVDGELLISKANTIAYEFSPIYGYTDTTGNNVGYAHAIPFRQKMYVTIETTSAEDASFSARLAIHYGTV